jgi:hypothetical protein
MKIFLQILNGLFLGVVGIFVCINLGTMLDGPPNWQTGVSILLVLVIGQGISFFTIRRHITFQVFSGLILCFVLIQTLLYSRWSFFWEKEYSVPDVGVPITWRSIFVLGFLVMITQGIAFLVFNSIRKGALNKICRK